MRLIINIKNNLRTKQNIVLMDSMFTNGKFTKKGITGTVEIIDDENKDNNRIIDYSLLVKQINIVPFIVKIEKTSNNRQIDFYTRSKKTLQYGWRYQDKPYLPLEPSLTKEGKARRWRYSAKHNYEMYSPEWNTEEWNIADTHELFVLDRMIVFELQLKPKQQFNIVIDVEPKIKIDDRMKINIPKILKKNENNIKE